MLRPSRLERSLGFTTAYYHVSPNARCGWPSHRPVIGRRPCRDFLALVALSGRPLQTSLSPFSVRSVYLAHLRHQSNAPLAMRG